jgi:hypothetical protein
MGIFGFACGRCWDYDCNCTPEELKKYDEQCKNNSKNSGLKISNTFPNVSPGDIIIKNSIQYYIKDVIDGIPIGDVYTNNSLESDFSVKIKEPYQKIISNT